jgi:hypothetical protein
MPVFGVRHGPFLVFAMRRFRRSRWSEIRTDALVVIAEHAAGVTATGPLCPAIATVLVFVARNAGKREVAP